MLAPSCTSAGCTAVGKRPRGVHDDVPLPPTDPSYRHRSPALPRFGGRPPLSDTGAPVRTALPYIRTSAARPGRSEESDTTWPRRERIGSERWWSGGSTGDCTCTCAICRSRSGGPPSARSGRSSDSGSLRRHDTGAGWGNRRSGSGRRHALAWSVAGWETAEVDMDAETVLFRRTSPRPRAGFRSKEARPVHPTAGWPEDLRLRGCPTNFPVRRPGRHQSGHGSVDTGARRPIGCRWRPQWGWPLDPRPSRPTPAVIRGRAPRSRPTATCGSSGRRSAARRNRCAAGSGLAVGPAGGGPARWRQCALPSRNGTRSLPSSTARRSS